MAAKYAENDRLGKLEAGFQQIRLVQNFQNLYNIVIEHQ